MTHRPPPSKVKSGNVVPDTERPSRSPTLYSDPRLGPPHLPAHDFMPLNGKGGEDLCGPYEPVVGWPEAVEEGWRFDGASGVCPESPDRVFVCSHFGLAEDRKTDLVWGKSLFSMPESPYATTAGRAKRAEHHVVEFDRDGHVIKSWTDHDELFGKLNRVFINPFDPEGHVWFTDSRNQKIYKFSNDGKELVLEIGEVAAGSTPEDPWKAQDIAWLPDGSFYTAGLGRIDRFAEDGTHEFSYSSRGSGPGEFYDLHGLVLDQKNGRAYLADRGNSRIQIFDMEWNFLDQWENIYLPNALRLSEDGHIWLADGFTERFLKYDLEGHLLTSWGQFGIAPGCTWSVHYFDTDSEGNLYVVENYGDRAQKYRPRPDVDPNDPRLIGPLVRY